MGEEVAAAMAGLQQQLFDIKKEMEKLKGKRDEEDEDMEEDNNAWVEEQPVAGWQEFLQAPKLPATAPAAKLLRTLLKDAPF